MGSCPCRSKRPADRPVEMQFGPSAGSLSSPGRPDALGTAEILIKFLKGQGTDSEERTLEDILKSNDDWMEACHNYVQWIFPTDEASMFNRAAPMMTPHVQKVCREDREIQANFDLILKRFLSFLGLEMKGDGGELRIV
ncbi:OGFR, partial [Symbiodinium microadriaticum]